MTRARARRHAIAEEIRAEVAAGGSPLPESGRKPGLAVVIVGENPASQIYVEQGAGVP